MAKKKQKGGRKPVKPEEKVILVGFYTKKANIDKVGGMEIAREMAKNYIENQFV
jgi:hypothetical protein